MATTKKYAKMVDADGVDVGVVGIVNVSDDGTVVGFPQTYTATTLEAKEARETLQTADTVALKALLPE